MFINPKGDIVYIDLSPVPNSPVDYVLVLDASETDAEKAIRTARDGGAVERDGDGDEIFYVVFAHEPRRMWDFTERTLRQELRKKQPV